MKKTFKQLIEQVEDGSRKITPQEIAEVEKYADRLFAKVGVDVSFTKHFIDRASDARNKPFITAAELVRLFKQQYRQHGKKIPKLGPDANGVLHDMATDINVPFILEWDPETQMLDLVSKTVMRTPTFRTGADQSIFSID